MNAMTDTPSPQPATLTLQTAAPPPSRRRLRGLLRLLLVLIVILGAVITGTWWFTEGRYIQSTDNAYVQGDIAVLGPRIEGDIIAIPVADNQFVHKGEPLIVLDDRDWQARLAEARATAAEAAATVETAERQVAQQRAMIDSATATIAQAQAEQTRATTDAARSTALAANGWASRQAHDLAIADARKADALLAAADAQRSAAQQTLAVNQAQVAQARARQQNVEAALQLAQNNLTYTVIRAPFDGIVGNRAAQIGAHVQPGALLIAIAPPPAQLYVVANFKETQLAHMSPAMKVILTPDIDSGDAIVGRVDSLAPATGALFSLLPPENATGNFTKVVQRVPVKIVLDPAAAAHAGWLRAGLSVTAEVDTRGPNAERLGLFAAAAAGLHDLVR